MDLEGAIAVVTGGSASRHASIAFAAPSQGKGPQRSGGRVSRR